MIKNPEVDLRLHYRKTIEISTIIALTLIIITFMVSKKFTVDISLLALETPAIQVEDIPITRTVKKVEVPRKPTIPVEDPEIDPAEDVEIDLFEFDDLEFAPPPPAPPEDEEIVPFFKVERPPLLIGGQQAIADYITKHNLFPTAATELGISGKALIGFFVDKNGIPQDVRIVQESPKDLGFGEKGMIVMKAMRFTPGMQRDKPVQVSMQQLISFTAQ